jgi:hypothetical protein
VKRGGVQVCGMHTAAESVVDARRCRTPRAVIFDLAALPKPGKN